MNLEDHIAFDDAIFTCLFAQRERLRTRLLAARAHSAAQLQTVAVITADLEEARAGIIALYPALPTSSV